MKVVAETAIKNIKIFFLPINLEPCIYIKITGNTYIKIASRPFFTAIKLEAIIINNIAHLRSLFLSEFAFCCINTFLFKIYYQISIRAIILIRYYFFKPTSGGSFENNKYKKTRSHRIVNKGSIHHP